MYKVIGLVLLVACFCLVTEAQLTFTSSWGGKRAAVTGTISCRSDDALQAIYKMIQMAGPRIRETVWDGTTVLSISAAKQQYNEAERFIVCQKS